ncbi:Dynein assembly factor with WDR repeat domains 1 [Apostasia shenzhenica]|uniref:Dynein assembly factor with WDR repeat domains 1 n=1 Tax=Apostasia shenzhenica TaxID=1088818 RepID=A0A2I0ALA1_9ASPA|nr:Dynein assembly factor with WDR repeat domains 1 [Apostasia shenzhenica]
MEINLGKLPFDLDFHPSASIVATALISGELDLYHYVADSQPQRLFQISAHAESCRAVRFIASGRVVLTASRDCSIHATDVETGRPIAHMNDAHEDSINRLITLTETTVATGDDEGYIKVWDTRQHSCCNTFDAHEDYVSDMTYISGTRQILATSGDGSLSVCSLRKNKVQARSEFSEDELLSLVIMKNGKKVICGTQSGPLLLYSWGHFEDCSDRLLGHPMSVDALLKLDEDTLISGSEDGVIRLVGILPNRIIQPLAEHSEYPIESLAFSYDRKYLGSISHDQMLKLWDLEEFLKTVIMES